MRWDNLFDDLEGQLEQELGAEETELRAEEERLRLGRLTLRDRLRALSVGEGAGPVRLSLTDGSTLDLSPHTFGRDWISGDVVDHSSRHIQFILPLDAIASLRLTRAQVSDSLEAAATPENERGLSRRRQAIELVLDEELIAGTIDRVGRDHLDLAVHEAGTARREVLISQYRVVPFSRVLLVRL
jgi:hypothetical protein